MSLQSSILHRYRLAFPDEPLRETSEKTGIQLTRVFRIINGSEMKLKEFEAFENALLNNSQAPTINQFMNLSKQSLECLSDKKIAYIMGQMAQAIQIHNVKNNNLRYLNQQLA